MRRHPSHSYQFAQPALGRNNGVPHATGSQSASMNPDEDWTKISDLAERRRIQNRIAQRNYRKKLKRRLEDLERRAGSTSPPPDQHGAQTNPQSGGSEEGSRKKKGPRQGPVSPGAPGPLGPMAPGFLHREDPSTMFARQHTRQLSASPPPSFTYSFPANEPPSQPTSFQPLPYPEYPNHAFYLPPLPPARPSMGSFEPSPAKPDPSFPDEDLTGHYNVDYSHPSGAAGVMASQAGPGSSIALNERHLPFHSPPLTTVHRYQRPPNAP